MTRTTLDIDDDLWKRFSVQVIYKHGNRYKKDVMIELVKAWTEREEKRHEKKQDTEKGDGR